MKSLRESAFFNSNRRLMERRSVLGATSAFQVDFFNERVWNPHEEMFEATRAYNHNSIFRSAVDVMRDFIIGDQIVVKSNDKFTERKGQAFIDFIKTHLWMSECVENTIKTGNGYLEMDFSRATRLPIKFNPIADSSRIYINSDEYGNPKKDKILDFINGEGIYRDVELTDEFYIQRLDESFRHPQAKWFDIGYYQTGYLANPYRVYGIPIPRKKIIHFRTNLGDGGQYGRSQLACSLNDNTILTEIEKSLAIIAKYKAVPRKIMSYGDKQLPATDDEVQDFIAYLETLEKDEDAIVNKPISMVDLSYNGQDINLDYIIRHIRKKLIAGIAPDFFIGMSGEINRSTAQTELLSYILAIRSKRWRFLEPVQELILSPWLKHHGLKLAWLEFGTLDFEEKAQKNSRVMSLWSSNAVTFNEMRKELGYPGIGPDGDMFFLEWQNSMMPEIGGGAMPGYEEQYMPTERLSTGGGDHGHAFRFREHRNPVGRYPNNPTGTLGIQRSFATAIRKSFRNKLQRAYTILKSTRLKEGMKEAVVNPDSVTGVINLLEELKRELEPEVFRHVAMAWARGNRFAAEKMEVGYPIPYDRRLLNLMQETSFSYIDKYSKEKQTELRSILTEGIQRGDSVTTIANQIREAFKITAYRSELIARAETIKAYNWSTREAIKAGAVTKRYKWITARDDRVDQHCKKLEGKMFDVNDPNSPMPVTDTHPNCRCAIVPVVEIEK